MIYSKFFTKKFLTLRLLKFSQSFFLAKTAACYGVKTHLSYSTLL